MSFPLEDCGRGVVTWKGMMAPIQSTWLESEDEMGLESWNPRTRLSQEGNLRMCTRAGGEVWPGGSVIC